ncbi:MAG: tetratricopeptide repeat protein, partial [Spirochaetia bacterium]|nr:tetratricopeptide repeat protein [Spirochaetia bacterium]
LDDLGLDAAPEEAPLDDLGLDAAPEEAPLDDLGLDAAPEEAPLDDLGMESPETTPEDLFEDLGLNSVPTQAPVEFGQDIPTETAMETPADDFTEDFGIDTDAGKPAGVQPSGEDFTFDDMSPPSLDDISPDIGSAKGRDRYDLESQFSELAGEQTDDEISNQQLNTLRHTLKSFTPVVRQNVINVLLENKLGKVDSSELITKLVEGASEGEIKQFLENKLGKKLAPAATSKEDHRKVIVTRKQYTDSGIERQEKLFKITKVAIVAVPLLLVIISSAYLFGIKKYLYMRDIKKGKEIILAQNFGSSDIPRAETYFSKALERYPDNSYAYLQFADAYRRKGLYENSFEKLFGKVKIKNEDKAVRIGDQEINNGENFWGIIQKVPIIRYKDKTKTILLINDIPWKLEKAGAYIKTHLDKEKDEAIVLYALGEFHSSPARKFSTSPYHNNRLGIDYYNRILNFKNSAPLFENEKFISKAILGIGDVFYDNGDYNRAHDYFEKIIRKDPYDVDGQTGMMKTLIKMYESPTYQTSDDPRLIIQQHSLIKHTYKIEKKLPLFMLAKLARFYIDLPDKDDLRIEYNTSPVDKVNNMALKSRAEELLNIMYNKTDEDIYGNKIYGNTFAEGYFQRGRYYRYVVKEYRMAMTQFEYAYRYDPGHFMALNDRAEILMELNDYEGAKKNLLLAEEKMDDQYMDTLGDRPEDETLLEADRGLVTFNLAKSMYLSGVKNLDSTTAWLRIQETGKFENQDEHGKEALIAMLDQVDMYLDKAESQGIKSDAARAELYYYRGWINYVKSDYARALFFWQSIAPSYDA